MATTTSFGLLYGAHDAYHEWSGQLTPHVSAVPVLPATLSGDPPKTGKDVPDGLFAASYRPCLIAHVYGESFSRRALDEISPLSKRRSELERFFYGNSQEADLDAAGRIMIPSFLGDHAKLQKDVVVVGVGEVVAAEVVKGDAPGCGPRTEVT